HHAAVNCRDVAAGLGVANEVEVDVTGEAGCIDAVAAQVERGSGCADIASGIEVNGAGDIQMEARAPRIDERRLQREAGTVAYADVAQTGKARDMAGDAGLAGQRGGIRDGPVTQQV